MRNQKDNGDIAGSKTVNNSLIRSRRNVSSKKSKVWCDETDDSLKLVEINSWASNLDERPIRLRKHRRPSVKNTYNSIRRDEELNKFENTWKRRHISDPYKSYEIVSQDGSAKMLKNSNSCKIRIKLSATFYKRLFINNRIKLLCDHCEELKITDSLVKNLSAVEDSSTTSSDSIYIIKEDSLIKFNSQDPWPSESLVSVADVADNNLSIEVNPNTMNEPFITLGSKASEESLKREQDVGKPNSLDQDVGNSSGMGSSSNTTKAYSCRLKSDYQKKKMPRGQLKTENPEKSRKPIYDLLEIKPSPIHGMGIFTRVDIPGGELLMKYEGEIIGKCMSDKREKSYLRNGIQSIYMFEVDQDLIIDATCTGNKARYINHSCNPNCYSVTDTSTMSIIYYTGRDIQQGEELTIDYNFNDGDEDEICNCNDPGCRSAALAAD